MRTACLSVYPCFSEDFYLGDKHNNHHFRRVNEAELSGTRELWITFSFAVLHGRQKMEKEALGFCKTLIKEIQKIESNLRSK